MAEDFQPAVFYIDLDSLFDTRLGTIALLGSEVVEKVISGGYYTREIEAFDGVDMAWFTERYGRRDVEVLRQSMVTPMTTIADIFAKQTLQALVSSPFRRQPIVELNIFPYVLQQEDVTQIIHGLKSVTGGMLDIRVISTDPKELTPKHVAENYVQMAMYDYCSWLDYHTAAKHFDEVQCPQVRLFVPALYKDEAARKLYQPIDAFTVIENFISPFIKIEFIRIEYFCVDFNRFAKHAKKVK